MFLTRPPYLAAFLLGLQLFDLGNFILNADSRLGTRARAPAPPKPIVELRSWFDKRLCPE
jgi:hypothetical protein